MPKFGKKSSRNVDTCHKDLKLILKESIKIVDFSVIETLRTEKKQMKYFADGKSKLDGVTKKSKHQANKNGESEAADILPYKKGTNAFSGRIKDKYRFYFMMGVVKSVAERLKKEGKITSKVRFGLDWDMDDVYDDQSFDDLPHIEIVL